MLRLGAIHDSLETSVTWDKIDKVIKNTTDAFNEQMKSIESFGSLSYRISQVYHEGVCIYFYVGINHCENTLEKFLGLTAAIKDTLVRSGAALSHHHGVGKRSQAKFIKYLPGSTKSVLTAVKHGIDPKNVFGVGNLIFDKNFYESKAKL